MVADPQASRREAAPAKVNLYLHLRGQRRDGYHLLDSLAVFPEIGDSLYLEAGPGLSLALGGPFGDGLPVSDDNLVMVAARGLGRRAGLTDANAALYLEKNLPVASGIGGGSSDAAAALRLLTRHWGVTLPDGLAASIGADVPVCLAAPRPTVMAGIGDRLEPGQAMPGFWMVLVNPLVGVETRAVFAATGRKDNLPPMAVPLTGLRDFASLIGWLRQQRNDLTPAAIELCPLIGEVLTALSDAPLARMSGSGATCFALFESETLASAAADNLRRAQPRWWVASAYVAPHRG